MELDGCCNRIVVFNGDYSTRRNGNAKLVVAAVLIAMIGAAFLLMTREQTARANAQAAYDFLANTLDGDSLTIEQVHEQLGRQPHSTRTPFKSRVVEEYVFAGPLEKHIVYAYYSVGAAKFLEATSLDQKLPDWESE